MAIIIGKCRFEGKKPSSTKIYGRMTIYHSGDVKRTGTSGAKTIWKGTGDVWVIFKSRQDVDKNEFRVTGKVQTCMDF